MLQVRDFTSDSEAWDAFAQTVGASFRCAFNATSAWQLEHHLVYELHRLELFESDRKIGQCAVGVGNRWRVFADGLQLADAARWREVMLAVLEHLGPGAYVYGSDWSLEPSREADIQALAEVSLDEVYRTNLEVVDFRNWPTWESYYRGLSKNVRRNVTKSEKSAATSEIIIDRRPLNALRLCAMRYATFRRKALAKGFAMRTFRSLLRSFAMRRFYEFGVYRVGGRTLAAYGGVRFGPNSFFLEAGATARNDGAAWRLLIVIMERAWRESCGKGVFALGSDDGSQEGTKAWDGLTRSRRACRAKPIPISILRFRYQRRPSV